MTPADCPLIGPAWDESALEPSGKQRYELSPAAWGEATPRRHEDELDAQRLREALQPPAAKLDIPIIDVIEIEFGNGEIDVNWFPDLDRAREWLEVLLDKSAEEDPGDDWEDDDWEDDDWEDDDWEDEPQDGDRGGGGGGGG